MRHFGTASVVKVIERIDAMEAEAEANPALRPALAEAWLAFSQALVWDGPDVPVRAETSASKAVDIYRDLAAQDFGHTLNFLRALRYFGQLLDELERRPAKAKPRVSLSNAEFFPLVRGQNATEAVEVSRRLVQADPVTYTPTLAESLNEAARVHLYLGRPHEALPFARDAVLLYSELAASNPEYNSLLESARATLRPLEGVSWQA